MDKHSPRLFRAQPAISKQFTPQINRCKYQLGKWQWVGGPGTLQFSAALNKKAGLWRPALLEDWLRGHDLNVRPSGYEL